MYTFEQVREALDKEDITEALSKLEVYAETEALPDVSRWARLERMGYRQGKDLHLPPGPDDLPLYRQRVTMIATNKIRGSRLPGVAPVVWGLAELDTYKDEDCTMLLDDHHRTGHAAIVPAPEIKKLIAAVRAEGRRLLAVSARPRASGKLASPLTPKAALPIVEAASTSPPVQIQDRENSSAMINPTKALTWIHISDIHFFGRRTPASPRFKQKIVTGEIVHDVELMQRHIGPPDFILITGDIAFSADSRVEYPAAAQWLEQLIAAAGIRPEQVLLVPGNHDVDRGIATSDLAHDVHERLREGRRKLEDVLLNPKYRDLIWPKLGAFAEFAGRYGGSKLSAEMPYCFLDLPSSLGKVVVLGLNTTLMSFDQHDAPNNLELGAGQLQAVHQQRRDTLLLSLQHHPSDWLKDGSELLSIIQNWPHIMFSGHVHEADAFVRNPLTGGGNLQFVAGAGFGDQAGEYSYSWGRLSPTGLEYFPRAWWKKRNKFIADRLDGEYREYAPQIGEYINYPRERLPKSLRDWLPPVPEDPPGHHKPMNSVHTELQEQFRKLEEENARLRRENIPFNALKATLEETEKLGGKPPVSLIMPGAGCTLGGHAGYIITANQGGSVRITWEGLHHFQGSITTESGALESFHPGAADGSCGLEPTDRVSRTSLDGIEIDSRPASTTRRGFDIKVRHGVLVLNLLFDGAVQLGRVVFVSADTKQPASAPVMPFGLVLPY